MQLISEEKINEIRNSADIVNIISDYIPLKMQGKNYFGVCPFHDDHTPSMSVSKERQMFKCFVCNKGGNVFTFVSEYENISFIEAVKKVADKVGIPLDIGNYKNADSKYKLEYEIMDFATKIFQNNLNSEKGIKAKEYLEGRSITEEVIKDFKIGYSLDDNSYLYNVLLKKKYELNTLDNLGLITKDGISGYDKFVNRIMIPITNLDGHVVGFTGRIFNNEDSAKYINTKETIIYKKGNILFNYYNAKNYIKDEKSAILVEGNMDAIRVYSSGIKNVLALMGTALTKEQINILKGLRVPIILMLDNDAAGWLATNTIGDALSNNGVEVKVVRLSGAKDPDEYIVKYGIEAFKDTIKNSVNYLDYKLNSLKNNKNLNNTEELILYVKDVIKLLDGKDNLTKEITIKRICDEYNLDYDILKKEISLDNKEDIVKPVIKKAKLDKYDRCVNEILYYLMCDVKYIKIFNKRLGYLKNREERELVREIEDYIEKYDKINVADFLSYIEFNTNIKELVNRIIESTNVMDLDEKIFLDYIDTLRVIINNEERKKLLSELKKETDIKKKLEISKKLTELVKGSVNNGRD
jgi:DNA primase